MDIGKTLDVPSSQGEYIHHTIHKWRKGRRRKNVETPFILLLWKRKKIKDRPRNVVHFRCWLIGTLNFYTLWFTRGGERKERGLEWGGSIGRGKGLLCCVQLWASPHIFTDSQKTVKLHGYLWAALLISSLELAEDDRSHNHLCFWWWWWWSLWLVIKKAASNSWDWTTSMWSIYYIYGDRSPPFLPSFLSFRMRFNGFDGLDPSPSDHQIGFESDEEAPLQNDINIYMRLAGLLWQLDL